MAQRPEPCTWRQSSVGYVRYGPRRPKSGCCADPHPTRRLQLVLVWRISAKPYWKFDGAGAKKAGVRWNSPGYAVVYTSATASLAVLELLVHLRRDRTVKDLVITSAEIPND